MSFPKNDRKFQSGSGNNVPNGSGGANFSLVISKALKAEFGYTPAAVKTVANLIGANERAVRNWFDGRNGPSGEHLITLMRSSAVVLESVLSLAGRRDLFAIVLVQDARRRLADVITALDALAEAPPPPPPRGSQ